MVTKNKDCGHTQKTIRALVSQLVSVETVFDLRLSIKY